MSARRFGRFTVETSNEDKVLFPGAGITKGDLIDYYARVADTMLPHVAGRPLSLHRFPDGIDEDGFFQKQVADHFPDWIERVKVDTEDGPQEQVVAKSAATLAYLANLGCVTPHVWLSRTDRLDHPDRLVLDLDPPGDDFAAVRTAARRCRELLDDLGLEPFVMTTGSRGLHVVAPLDRAAGFDEVRAFVRNAADTLARRHPDMLTTEHRRTKRRGRLYLDTTRNAYGQTVVAPYAVRARAGAPVATPLAWDEVGRRDARSFTVRNLFRRLGQRPCPWRGLARHARGLAGPTEALARLRGPAGA